MSAFPNQCNGQLTSSSRNTTHNFNLFFISAAVQIKKFNIAESLTAPE